MDNMILFDYVYDDKVHFDEYFCCLKRPLVLELEMEMEYFHPVGIYWKT